MSDFANACFDAQSEPWIYSFMLLRPDLIEGEQILLYKDKDADGNVQGQTETNRPVSSDL